MIAMLLTALAFAGPTITVGTGSRPLDGPAVGSVFGTGPFRLGLALGPVEPWLGGGLQWGGVDTPDDSRHTGVNWHAGGGLRVGLGKPELDPYLRAGTWWQSGTLKNDWPGGGDDDEGNFDSELGVQAGFGADALIPDSRIQLGAEVGVARGDADFAVTYGGDAGDTVSVSGWYTWSELHVRILLGRRP